MQVYHWQWCKFHVKSQLVPFVLVANAIVRNPRVSPQPPRFLVLVMINVSSGSNVLRNVKYAKEFALLIVVNLYVKNHHHQMFRAISRWSMYLIRANAEYSHFIVKWYSMFTTCLIVLLKGILLVPSLHIFHKTSAS